MILYADGCSFIEGTELFIEAYPEYIPYNNLLVYSNDHIARLGYPHLAHYNETHCFPALIANELNWTLVNRATSGSSNAFIAKNVITNLTFLLEQYDASEIVALVSWSEVSRRFTIGSGGINIYLPPSNTIMYGQPFQQHYYRHLTTHILHETLLGTLSLLNSINSVRAFCKRHGIKLLMMHSLSYQFIDQNKEYKDYVYNALSTPYWQRIFDEYVETHDFYYYQQDPNLTDMVGLVNTMFLGSISNFSAFNLFPQCPNGHPGFKTHEAWSKLILKEMYKRNIV